jgi:hypothetical protein
MAGYGGDVSVYVEDRAGDQGDPNFGSGPFWLSPDVDIPAHTGVAGQGSNTVQIRVHARDEPVLEEKITAEVYVGTPSLAMSPSVGTKRIDPGITFRPATVAGTEPVADIPGGTTTFTWTPSSDPAQVDGPGHRCLVVRAFPQSVSPPGDPFTVATEQHEAQHNIEILATTKMIMGGDGAGGGTPHDPRRRNKDGLWSERISTVGAGRVGVRYVVWAFDPSPASVITRVLPPHSVISKEPPKQVTFEPDPKNGNAIDPHKLLDNGPFTEKSGFGRGLFAPDRLLAGAEVELHPNEIVKLLLRFDHSNLKPRSVVVLHGVQWDESGRAEGGMTVVAVAPV